MKRIPIKETYIQGLPDHLNSPENKLWFASVQLEAIEQENHKVIITTWRHTSLDRVVESTIELEVDETITWAGDELIDPDRLSYLEEAATENLELRRKIHSLGQKYLKLENRLEEMEAIENSDE